MTPVPRGCLGTCIKHGQVLLFHLPCWQLSIELLPLNYIFVPCAGRPGHTAPFTSCMFYWRNRLLSNAAIFSHFQFPPTSHMLLDLNQPHGAYGRTPAVCEPLVKTTAKLKWGEKNKCLLSERVRSDRNKCCAPPSVVRPQSCKLLPWMPLISESAVPPREGRCEVSALTFGFRAGKKKSKVGRWSRETGNMRADEAKGSR